MAHINLLPWREEALRIQQKNFFTVLGGVILFSFAILFLVSLYYQAKIDGQIKKNIYLKNEVQLLDIRIAKIKELNAKKIALKKRMSVIEQLQQSRNVGAQVLNEIAKIIPNGIYITQLEKEGSTIFIQGKSESNNHLANMIRAIGLSDLLTDAQLASITSDEKAQKLLSDFKMQIRIKGLVDDL